MRQDQAPDMLLGVSGRETPSGASRPMGERLKEIRRDLHAHPELGFQETRTATIVAGFLADLKVQVHSGIGRTGLVGVIRRGSSARRIGLRADMDALPIQETGTVPHRSRHDGVMHACGHDGHIVMLLAAAERLVRSDAFDGTVVLIFQPAEEGVGGANAMIADGLFETFPLDAVFGMHNWPGLAPGRFGVLPGPVMASCDHFDIHIEGLSAHAGLPHDAIDPIVAGAQLVQEIQTIVSREVAPFEAGVVSVTRIHAGDTYNVIPRSATIGGTVRTFSPHVQDVVEQAMGRLCKGKQEGTGAKIALDYRRDYPPTINSRELAEVCRAAAVDVAGHDAVVEGLTPSMAAEDFSSMLQRVPGCYVWIGNGPAEGGCFLHGSSYDFNDDIIDMGARYWVRVVERMLARPRDC